MAQLLLVLGSCGTALRAGSGVFSGGDRAAEMRLHHRQHENILVPYEARLSARGSSKLRKSLSNSPEEQCSLQCVVQGNAHSLRLEPSCTTYASLSPNVSPEPQNVCP